MTCTIKNLLNRLKIYIYEAKIKANNQSKNYIGLSSNGIKNRKARYKITMKSNPEDKKYHKYVNATEMSKLIHKLKTKSNI